MVKVIPAAEVSEFINAIPNGKFFSLHFKRVAPKCMHCEASDKKWQGMTHCPNCGAELSLERESIAQKGVKHPHDVTITPNGNGESAKEAFVAGRLKYYDTHAQGYRQARIENIQRITYNGDDYYVVHGMKK